MGGIDYLISGCSPEGVRHRLEACRLDSGSMHCLPWEYGTRLTVAGGTAAANELMNSFSPFIHAVEGSGSANPATGLVDRASEAGGTIVLAESCTGGLAGALITEISGSSAVFWGSLVTYANEAKEKVLGVDTLARFGAVSEATVLSMAQGALALSGTDAAAAISGIAGPGGGTEEKPVGTVWFAFAGDGGIKALCCRFSGDRGDVRNKAASVAVCGLENQFRKPILDIGWIAEYTFY